MVLSFGLIITRHMLVVWNGLLVAVFSPVRLGDGGTDWHEILHDATYQSWTGILPFGGGGPGIPKIRNFWS